MRRRRTPRVPFTEIFPSAPIHGTPADTKIEEPAAFVDSPARRVVHDCTCFPDRDVTDDDVCDAIQTGRCIPPPPGALEAYIKLIDVERQRRPAEAMLVDEIRRLRAKIVEGESARREAAVPSQGSPTPRSVTSPPSTQSDSAQKR